VADTRRTRRARRGRPAKTAPPPTEAGYRLMVEVEALANPEEANGWTVLATTVGAEVCTDAEILEAYQEQHTTVAPGFRWGKHPAALAPGWLEKPERIAAWALRTVVGLLVYSVSSLPIMEKGEQFLKVIEIFALLCSHYKMSL